MSKHFITTILGDMKGNAVMGRSNGFTERGKLRVDVYQWFKYPEQIDAMAEYAMKHSDSDVYLSPMIYGDKISEKTKQLSRSKDNALYAQTVFMDSDTCPPEAFRIRPSVHVDTSEGHGHDYWVLPEPVPASEAAEVAHRITTAHAKQGCDPSGWSQNKVLRVPDTHNTGHGFPEIVTAEYNGTIHDLLDISGAYDDIVVTDKPVALPSDFTHNIPQTPDHLPKYSAELLGKLSRSTLNLVTAEPKIGETGNRSEMRWRMLLDLMRDPAGLSDEEVLSIAWNAPAASKWHDDARQFDGLLGEFTGAKAVYLNESGQLNDPAPELKPSQTVANDGVSLLSDDERAIVASEQTFIKKYVAWTRSRVTKQNAPYDRMNAWNILSVVFSDTVFIPRSNGPESTCMYVCIIGKTTTGKSQAAKNMRSVLREAKAEDPEFNIGGNASESALSMHLIKRDQKVSWFNKDEAQSLLKTWTGQDWATGMLDITAQLYDNEVPAMLRTGNNENNGKGAIAYFVMWLQGTWEILDVMTKDHIKSGWIPRFQFAIGEERDPDNEEDEDEDQSDGSAIKSGFEPVARQWAAEWNEHKRKLVAAAGAKTVPMLMDDASLVRMKAVRRDLKALALAHEDRESMLPAVTRMAVTIRKAATLLAASDGSRMVGLKHVLCALEAAEEWVANLLTVVERIADSEFKKKVDELVRYVESFGEGKVASAQVYRKFSSLRPRELEEIIAGGIAQGYLIDKTEGKRWIIRNR